MVHLVSRVTPRVLSWGDWRGEPSGKEVVADCHSRGACFGGEHQLSLAERAPAFVGDIDPPVAELAVGLTEYFGDVAIAKIHQRLPL